MAGLGEPALSRTGLQQPRWARWRGWLQDILVGYAPGRALAWLVAAFAAGTLYYWGHHPPPVDIAAHPSFNAALYSFNLLVPVLGIGAASDWNPQGTELYVAVAMRVLGWRSRSSQRSPERSAGTSIRTSRNPDRARRIDVVAHHDHPLGGRRVRRSAFHVWCCHSILCLNFSCRAGCFRTICGPSRLLRTAIAGPSQA